MSELIYSCGDVSFERGDIAQLASPRRLCGIYSRDGGWQIPAALRHVPPRDPDGTWTDSPQAADLHWAAHSTSPIPSLRSSAARRCDNCHEIVELDRDLGFGSHIEDRQAPTLTPLRRRGVGVCTGPSREKERKTRRNSLRIFRCLSLCGEKHKIISGPLLSYHEA